MYKNSKTWRLNVIAIKLDNSKEWKKATKIRIYVYKQKLAHEQMID